MRLTRQVEIQPTPAQEQALRQHAGNARWAYNWGLEQHRQAYERWKSLGKPKKWDGWPNAYSLHRELVKLKQTVEDEGGVPWMYEASKCAPQEGLRDLDRAFKNFLAGRARYPRFKSRSRGIGGFRLTGTIRVDERAVQLPRIGRVRLKPGERSYIPASHYAQASVHECAGRWYVSITPKVEAAELPPNGLPAVGLDLGVVRLATLSDGSWIENPRALQRDKRKIRRLQKGLSRKQRGSRNRRKARASLARAHRRVRNARHDVLRKSTTMLAKSHGRIVVEDLRVKQMTKRGRGKRGLNRSLLDASFGEFRRQLAYKCRLYGSELVLVEPAYTSQRCSACGHTDSQNRRSRAEFRCLSCGFEANADHNAACNILVAGSCPETTKNACGADVRPDSRQLAAKQESVSGRLSTL